MKRTPANDWFSKRSAQNTNRNSQHPAERLQAPRKSLGHRKRTQTQFMQPRLNVVRAHDARSLFVAGTTNTKTIHGGRRSAIKRRSTSEAETTTNTITTSFRSSVGSSKVARPSKAKAIKTNTGRLTVNRRIESLSTSERFSFTAKTIHAIAQQVGQPERRSTRFLSSQVFWPPPGYLGRWPINRNQPQVHRAINGLSPFDAESRKCSRPIALTRSEVIHVGTT